MYRFFDKYTLYMIVAPDEEEADRLFEIAKRTSIRHYAQNNITAISCESCRLTEVDLTRPAVFEVPILSPEVTGGE